MKFNRLEDANVAGKNVLVRVDFNVPRAADGSITDDTRLRAALPTINYLREQNAKVVLLSHFGRPKGKVEPEFSLRFIVPALSEAIGDEVYFSTDIGRAAIDAMPAGHVMLLENTRFHAGESKGNVELARQYSELGDIFVADAFSVSHRNHASSAGIAAFLPAYAGLAMEREIDHICQALDVPIRPVMGIVGGAKVSTKIDLLMNLVERLDILAIGGGMANTFLYAQGYQVGRSLLEKDYKATALEIMEKAKKTGCRIILPTDLIAATEFKTHAPHRVCALDEVAKTEMILDAGPETVNVLADAMDSAKTLIWNGPLGAFEIPPFDTSSVEAAKYAAKLTKSGKLISVAGGGDTVSALNHAGVSNDFTFISTAGGAFLEWMEGKALPGVEILTDSGPQSGAGMANAAMAEKVAKQDGFIAALDQSGGSTPKALLNYGIQADEYSDDDEMFALVHAMRARIIKSGAFKGDKVVGAILFERTMDGEIDGIPTAQYLWETCQVVPFLKVDKGLAKEKDGVQILKPMPKLDDLCERAVRKGIFGTKMRSNINAANRKGINAVVSQQFETGMKILSHGLMPIIEPEVNITIADKSQAEDMLFDALLTHLDGMPDHWQVMLKLTLPETSNRYQALVDHPRAMRVVALSGGYSRDEATRRLSQNTGMIASFSRALTEGLSSQQSDLDFDAKLADSIEVIFEASRSA